MLITQDEIVRIMPHAKHRLELFYEPLVAAMDEFEISENALRAAAFLAQIAHESGELRYAEELASGDAYDTGRLAERLGNTPEDDDDGQKWKGRGLIQITGHDNYHAVYEYFGPEKGWEATEDVVGWLQVPEGACRSAGWFWSTRRLNALADRGDFLLITKKVNGGTNGWVDRKKYYDRALQVFS